MAINKITKIWDSENPFSWGTKDESQHFSGSCFVRRIGFICRNLPQETRFRRNQVRVWICRRVPRLVWTRPVSVWTAKADVASCRSALTLQETFFLKNSDVGQENSSRTSERFEGKTLSPSGMLMGVGRIPSSWQRPGFLLYGVFSLSACVCRHVHHPAAAALPAGFLRVCGLWCVFLTDLIIWCLWVLVLSEARLPSTTSLWLHEEFVSDYCLFLLGFQSQRHNPESHVPVSWTRFTAVRSSAWDLLKEELLNGGRKVLIQELWEFLETAKQTASTLPQLSWRVFFSLISWHMFCY